MSDILESISNFFTRHRAHCALHDVYQADCASCVSANEPSYVAGLDVAGVEFSSGDAGAPVDISGLDMSATDVSGSDTSSADVSGASDFGGFDGGDSGGGGAAGDF